MTDPIDAVPVHADESPARLMTLLKTRGPQTAQALADGLSMTPQGARQHLARLAEDGLVDFEDRREKVGRPARYWHLSEAGHARFPDAHAMLTVELIEGARRVFGQDGVDRLIADREARVAESYRAATAAAEGLEGRVAALAAQRTREGYMAEWRRDGDGFVLIENHCPICAAASACQGFCRSELAVFRDVLGPDAAVERTDHILSGARRCAYRVTPTGAGA
ncbi:MAG: transcriptional regulator [Azospirillaceae bacterium]